MTTKLNVKRTAIASGIALGIGAATSVQAVQVLDVLNVGIGLNFYTDSANLTMLNADGGTVGGTNDVSMVWNGNAFTDSSDYSGPGSSISNITASTTTTFFGHNWTAHDIQVFVPGSYTFDVTLGGGNPETGTVAATVPLGGFGVHMLFDWNGNLNIDVFVVAGLLQQFGSGVGRSTAGVTVSSANNCDAGVIKNCLWDGAKLGPAGKPAGDHQWLLASTDAAGGLVDLGLLGIGGLLGGLGLEDIIPVADGVMGIPMAPGGPFAGFNANFNADMSLTPPAVPVPAAVWLLGSGLLGLVGVARRKNGA
jgi:hypothetical protein